MDKKKPKYRWLADILQEAILSGALEYNRKVPTEFTLMAEYGLSRITVRQALALLEQSGYIRRVQGKGSFVTYRKTHMQLNALQSFSEEMRQKGYEPSSRLLSLERRAAGEDIAQRLGIGAWSEIYLLRRLRLADDMPMCLERLHVPVSLCPALETLPMDGSLYDIFRNHYGHVLRYAQQEVEAGLVRAEEAEYLAVREGMPALLAFRTTYMEDKKPLEFVASVFRSDRYRITARLEYNEEM